MSFDRKEVLKNILKELHKGVPIEDLKNKLKEVLSEIPPFEIPLIEQELIKEGIDISEIIKLCDLHVELLRDLLKPKELKEVPKGHPLDLLSRENEQLSKITEILNIYASALSKAKSSEEIENYLKLINNIVNELRKFRNHYRKIQMLIFPYLERRGIITVPRVLWNKEDQAILKIRNLSNLIENAISNYDKYINEIVEKSFELSKELQDLIFREERILFPSLWILLSEGEWIAIHGIAKEMGYLVNIDEEWKSEAKPLLPYEIIGTITPEQMNKLPEQFISSLIPDTYEIKSKDFEFNNGFLNKEEIEAIFNHLPIEITYADSNNRVTFFSQSIFRKGFVRTKTILGRKFEFCHPPRLEKFVSSVVNELISGKSDFKEYWTKLGDRIIRVMVIAVRNNNGEHLGILEIVEDLTEIINNSEEVKKKIIIL
ncbi:MAG: DUF438 domain-containing protein [Candidatus Methanomethylicaceae archaeon]